MGFYGNEPIIINSIISCDQPPLILHSQTTFHSHICKEQGKDWFYSNFVLQSIIKMFTLNWVWQGGGVTCLKGI